MSGVVRERKFDISVVIPTHNRAQILGRALDSVVGQTYPVKEIIVVDDGSTDDTQELLARCYPQVTIIAQQNRGVSAARNTGIKAARGNWIALLDSDDEWLPEKLDAQAETLGENDEMQFCHTDEIWIRNGRRVNAMHKHQKTGGWIYRHCLPLCAISPSSALMHRSVFDACGLFDESLPACEDYDMWLRVCSRMPVAYVDKKLIAKYGGHDDQLSKRHWGMDRFRVTALQTILHTDLLTDENRKATVNTLIEKIKILINGAEKRGHANTASHYRAILTRYGHSTSDGLPIEGKAA